MFRKELCLFLTLALLGACSRLGGGLFSDGKPAVSVEKVLVEEKQATVSVLATLEPSEKIEIQLPMDVKIEKVHPNLGDTVHAGDPLFSLNEQDFALKLAQLKAQRMEQEALLEKNNYFFKNRDRLLQEGKIDKSMYDALEAEVKTSESGVERLKADIAVTDNQIHQLSITAPFSGLVSLKNIVGGAVANAHRPLLTLVKPDPMYVTFNLPSADAQNVEKGMSVNVRVEDFGDQTFSAPIVFINPELDAGNKTFVVKASLPNPKLIFKGGGSAQVSFTGPQKVKVLSIPTKSLLSDNGREYVYLVRQNRAWRVRIYTRKSLDNPDMTEIVEGLTDADIVVTEGQNQLKEGAEVNLWR